MPIFGSNAIGIDLGTSHTAVYLPDKGLALREATRALVNASNPQDVIAVGAAARAMQGRVKDESLIMEPIQMGAVADVEIAALLILALTEKAAGRKKPMDKSLIATSCPAGLTRVERSALFQALTATGAKRMAMVKSPVAALLGAGVDIETPKASMCVLLGGGTTEIAVVASQSVVAARLLRQGGQAADEEIVNWFWREKGVVIGLRTADQIKREMGTALAEPDADNPGEPVLLRGKSASTGETQSVEITPQDVRRALEPYVVRILDAMRNALRNTPAELIGDIRENGIQLTGGGALLTGLAERLEKDTGVPVRVSSHPQDDVALGVGGAASDDRILSDLISSGAADDVG